MTNNNSRIVRKRHANSSINNDNKRQQRHVNKTCNGLIRRHQPTSAVSTRTEADIN